LEVIFDAERKAYVSCTTDGIDIFGLPEHAEYIEELHSGDGLLHVQDTRDGDGLLSAQNTAMGIGGDGLLHGRPNDISGTGEGHRGGDHSHTDDVTDVHCHLPDDHMLCGSLPACTGSRSYPPDKGDTIILAHSCDDSTCKPLASRQHIQHSRCLHSENYTARRQAAAMTMKSIQRPPPLIMRCITRNQGKASMEALMASALASTTINEDLLTYAEAMAGAL